MGVREKNMHRHLVAGTVLSSFLLCFSVYSAPVNVQIWHEYTDYSGGYGKRNVTNMELNNKVYNGALIAGFATGERRFDNGKSFHGNKGKVTLYYNWLPSFYTRTGVSFADDSPVFARREVFNDLNFKIIKGGVFTVGGRHATYFEDNEVNSWNIGSSIYAGSLMLRYQYTRYYNAGPGQSYSHVASLRIKDEKGNGSTQLWFGGGTGAYTYDWMPESRAGKLYSLSLKRVQPLRKDLNINVSVGKQWFDTPVSSYSGVMGMFGLVYSF
ncbi:TPA: YaiO family outer membrane beta-barrel protein [Escherichia coli]|nr:YaiO family outer membrane beta-barrel protein [Escherichia coli]